MQQPAQFFVHISIPNMEHIWYQDKFKYFSLGCKPSFVHQRRIFHGAALIAIRIKAPSLSMDPTSGNISGATVVIVGKMPLDCRFDSYRKFEPCPANCIKAAGAVIESG